MPGIDISEAIHKEKPFKKQGKGIFHHINLVLNSDITFFNNQFSSKKKLSFYTDLQILLYSGIDIKTAFELVQDNFKKKEEKKIIEQVKLNIINGDGLSESLSKTGKFSMYEIFSIKIGEETGKLNNVLSELCSYFTRKTEQKRKITSAFSYPVIVLLTAFGAVFFMMQFIVPMFEDVFKRFGNDLPVLTQFIINVSHGFKKYFLLVIVFIVLLIILVYMFRNNPVYRKISTSVILKIPVFGKLVRQINISRFCLGLELLLSSKTPILKAVQLIQKMVTFYPIEASMKQIEKDLMHGISLHQSMEKFEIYDKRMISLIKVAEEVNQLDKVFGQLKDQYNNEVEYLASNINSIMEPLLIIFIGIFVGLILVSMYLPMFQLSTGVSF
ncbi:MAG: type II secretion system F family protein [Bacteroidales bacterium]